jgi:ATP-binding cassette, subfamily B, bacterial
MLVMILLSTGTSLLTPLIFRNMIDVVLPAKDTDSLIWLGLALLFIPALNGGINVIQRRLNSTVGEGVIYDLRSSLFARLQRMSLRFFTNTKTGELMSRLNSDVVGAQNAISNTIVNIVTNLIQTDCLLAVMLTLEWRLTVISVLILPLFILVAQRLGLVLRDIARDGMDKNAQMNAHMNETLNIGGALLVKLFGRTREEEKRFRERAANVRDIGIRRAVVGSSFFVIMVLVTRSARRSSTGWAATSSSPMSSPSAPSSPSARISVNSTARCKGWLARLSSFPPAWSVSSASSKSLICRRTSPKKRTPSNCAT